MNRPIRLSVGREHLDVSSRWHVCKELVVDLLTDGDWYSKEGVHCRRGEQVTIG
jgi:hypothetical protein